MPGPSLPVPRPGSRLAPGLVPRSARALGAFLAFLLVLGGCAGAPRLDSRWLDGGILVDGTDGEWPQTRYLLDEQVPVTVGVRNDGQALYLCLVTADRALQARVLAAGIEVWLDPEGGRDKHVGWRLAGLPRPDRATGDRLPLADGARRAPPDSADFGRPFLRGGAADLSDEALTRRFQAWAAQADLRLVDGEDDDGTPLQPGADDPVQIRAGRDQGRLVLELRLPLAFRGYPAYEVAAGGRVGIAVRVPAPAFVPRGGGGGGRAGGRPGGMGGGMTGGMQEIGGDGRFGSGGVGAALPVTEPLQQWVQVQLARAR